MTPPGSPPAGAGPSCGGATTRPWWKANALDDAKEIRAQADELFKFGERLRFALLGFGGDSRTACRLVEEALGKFSVPDDPQWMQRPSIQLLDPKRRDQLLGEVNELLFLWVVVLDGDRRDDPAMARQAVQICDAALTFAAPPAPWHALRRAMPPCSTASLRPVSPIASAADESAGSARACFQWGLLCDLEGRGEATIAWLERADREHAERLLVPVLPGLLR